MKASLHCGLGVQHYEPMDYLVCMQRVSSHFTQSQFAQSRLRVRKWDWDWAKWGRTMQRWIHLSKTDIQKLENVLNNW